jgi:hypothetical protein
MALLVIPVCVTQTPDDNGLTDGYEINVVGDNHLYSFFVG